jgi:hypothetical protein
MFAGVEVLFQRAEVFVTNLFGDDGSLLEDKHQLERYYKELISTAKENYQALLSLDISAYKENLQVYQ